MCSWYIVSREESRVSEGLSVALINKMMVTDSNSVLEYSSAYHSKLT